MKYYFFITFIFLLTSLTEAAPVLNRSIYDLSELPADVSDDTKKELVQTNKAGLIAAEITKKKARKTQLEAIIQSAAFKRAQARLVMQFREKFTFLPLDVCLALAKHFLMVARYTIGNTLDYIAPDCIAQPTKAMLTNATQWVEANHNILKQITGPDIETQLNQICPIEDNQKSLTRVKGEIESLQDILKRNNIIELENLYIVKKDKMPEPWQKVIEESLISASGYGWDGLGSIKYYISYATETMTLSKALEDLFVLKPTFQNAFKEGSKILHNFLKDDLLMPEFMRLKWVNIFKNIARAAEQKKRHFAYCQTHDTDMVVASAVHIAKLMKVPFYVIDATQYAFSAELIYGLKATNVGSLLTNLFCTMKDEKTYLNPILIIINFDECVTAENMPWLLDLFDKEVKTYHDHYLNLDVDCSQLNIIVSGVTDPSTFTKALKDRLGNKINFE